MQTIFWLDFLQRLRAGRPAFFKKLQMVALVLGAISAGFGWYVGQAVAAPETLITISKYLSTFCSSVWFTSFLPNNDAKAQDKTDSPTPK